MLPYAYHCYVDASNELMDIPPGIQRNREATELLDDMRIPNELHFRNIQMPSTFHRVREFDLTLMEREELLHLIAEEPHLLPEDLTEAFTMWWIEAHNFPNVDFEAQLVYVD